VIQQIFANSPTYKVDFVETDVVTNTDRGAGGFGSTGA
jgi:dUTPase